MKLVFVHGWGFDARVWDAVIACLPNDDIVRLDLGYFGERLWTVVEGPCLAITHSFGTMALLADPPAGCRGLVAINGFDRFTQTTDRPGVPRRLLDRMMARMESDPGAVLGEFHARLGSAVPGGGRAASSDSVQRRARGGRATAQPGASATRMVRHTIA